MNELGVYVHIPFCKSKCAYCDFYSLADSQALMNPYVKALSARILRKARGLTKNTRWIRCILAAEHRPCSESAQACAADQRDFKGL